jgi:hypothetical protein
VNQRPLVPPRVAAARLGISRRQLLRLNIARVQLGPKTIRYEEEVLNEFVAKKRIGN